jgi:hypothetical protein
MFETYRMLGREREIELLAEARRLHALAEHRAKPDIRTTLFVIGIAAVAALAVWMGISIASI